MFSPERQACPSFLSHGCVGQRNTTLCRPATEMPKEALCGNCRWDRMDGAGFRTWYREKDWKVLPGALYLKHWSAYNLSPCLFCHISSSISPMHLEGSSVTQTNKISSNVSHRRELNLANFYWSFTCTTVRGLSKIHWLCVAFICWPQWISLLQLCCPSHVCALAEGE